MQPTQNYSNHVRWFPLVHFVITPILLILIVWSVVDMVQGFSLQNLQFFVLAVTTLLLSFAARLQALKAQDRIIRLEERFRYRELLQDDVAERTGSLRTSQMIALRFASDEELPVLVERVLSGELSSGKEIKQAIKNWRGDYLRV